MTMRLRACGWLLCGAVAAALPVLNHTIQGAEQESTPAIKEQGPVVDEDSPVKAADWQEPWNGRDLTDWVAEGSKEVPARGNQPARPVWTVQDGVLHCAGHGFGFLRYDRQLTDFELRLEFRLAKGANSGIGLRHLRYDPAKSVATRPSYSGYELQLLDDAGRPPDDHATGSLYRYVAPKLQAVKPAEEWNEIAIVCHGPRIQVTLNGQVIQDVDQSTNPAIAKKPLAGYISLQNHGSRVEFREIRLREIK